MSFKESLNDLSLQLHASVPTFVLVFFRIAALSAFAPLFGSKKVPKRVKVLMSLVLAFVLSGTLHTAPKLPDSTWQLALGIAGEIIFGIAMGMVLSFT